MYGKISNEEAGKNPRILSLGGSFRTEHAENPYRINFVRF